MAKNKKIKVKKVAAKKKKVAVKKTPAKKKKIVTVNRASIPTPYAMELKINDQVFESKGQTFEGTFDELSKAVGSLVIKTKCKFTLMLEGRSAYAVMLPFQMRRLLSEKVTERQFFEKRMTTQLK